MHLSSIWQLAIWCATCGSALSAIFDIAPSYHVLSVRAEVYILPILAYELDHLEPYITREMMLAHYEGHHDGYRRKMNAALNEWREDEPTNQLTTQPLTKILMNLDKVPEKFRLRLHNNLGGYANHAIFWSIMSPNPNGTERFPPDYLENEINTNFGSLAELKKKFTDAALDLFGSGYVWIVRDRSAPTGMQLSVISTANQDCPVSKSLWPILVIDVWEHAYYLKHQFRRADYVKDWWMVVDWENVARIDRFWKKILDTDLEGEHDEL